MTLSARARSASAASSFFNRRYRSDRVPWRRHTLGMSNRSSTAKLRSMCRSEPFQSFSAIETLACTFQASPCKLGSAVDKADARKRCVGASPAETGGQPNVAESELRVHPNSASVARAR
jgi:hypothetical protein